MLHYKYSYRVPALLRYTQILGYVMEGSLSVCTILSVVLLTLWIIALRGKCNKKIAQPADAAAARYRPDNGQQMTFPCVSLIDQPLHNFSTDGEDCYIEFPEPRHNSDTANPVYEALSDFCTDGENRSAWTSVEADRGLDKAKACRVKPTKKTPDQTTPGNNPFQSSDKAGCQKLPDFFEDDSEEEHTYECPEDIKK